MILLCSSKRRTVSAPAEGDFCFPPEQKVDARSLLQNCFDVVVVVVVATLGSTWSTLSRPGRHRTQREIWFFEESSRLGGHCCRKRHYYRFPSSRRDRCYVSMFVSKYSLRLKRQQHARDIILLRTGRSAHYMRV